MNGKLTTAITAALVVSIALNVLLAHRLKGLTNVQAARISEYQLKRGVTVPPITAKRLDGQQEVISHQGGTQPTVLYIFTPPCHSCARNLDNIKTLFDNEREKYRFVGLSMSPEGLEQYVAKNDLKLPVCSGLSTETLKAYKMSGTPQTIVVSPEGRVVRNWSGAYEGDQISQVKAFFQVKLPGLRPDPASGQN
jgi:peroxiredoxin